MSSGRCPGTVRGGSSYLTILQEGIPAGVRLIRKGASATCCERKGSVWNREGKNKQVVTESEAPASVVGITDAEDAMVRKKCDESKVMLHRSKNWKGAHNISRGAVP